MDEEPQWTQTPPSQRGFYWLWPHRSLYFHTTDGMPEPCEPHLEGVDYINGKWCFGTLGEPIPVTTWKHYWWKGPIKLPDPPSGLPELPP